MSILRPPFSTPLLLQEAIWDKIKTKAIFGKYEKNRNGKCFQSENITDTRAVTVTRSHAYAINLRQTEVSTRARAENLANRFRFSGLCESVLVRTYVCVRPAPSLQLFALSIGAPATRADTYRLILIKYRSQHCSRPPASAAAVHPFSFLPPRDNEATHAVQRRWKLIRNVLPRQILVVVDWVPLIRASRAARSQIKGIPAVHAGLFEVPILWRRWVQLGLSITQVSAAKMISYQLQNHSHEMCVK